MTFQLDPARSSIEISGTIAGITISQQGEGSLRTTYSGPIIADLNAGSIAFTGGSAIDARTSGDWQPKPGGAAGVAPADYGLNAVAGFLSGKGALRNLLLDVRSGVLLLNNSEFNSQGLTFHFLTNSSASVDYNTPFGSGTEPLSGLSTNSVSNKSRVETAGENQEVIIPIDTTLVFRALSTEDSRVRFVGQFVATRKAGSNPTPLEISGIDFEDRSLTVRFSAQANITVERTENLAQWVDKDAARKTNGSTVEVSLPVGPGMEFFRLRKD